MTKAKSPTELLTRLRLNLFEFFSKEELESLAFDLGIKYDGLPGDGTEAKSRELVDYLERHGRIPELVERGRTLRPQLGWGNLSAIAGVDAARAHSTPDQYSASEAPNPFGDVGRITDPGRFFDREELLRQVFEELAKGVNLSLVGESQVGKSSVLSMVCTLGPERMRLPSETFVYLSLEWVKDEKEFYAALCDALHIEQCRGYSLTRALRGKRFVLCLDEFEKMAWKGFSKDLRGHLRGLADGHDAPLKLVIASRSPLAHLFPDSPEMDSPLAGICHQLDVGPIPPDIARAFLHHRLRGTGMAFAESDIAVLLRETGGHPAKLQRAAAELYRHHVSRFTPHATRE